MDETGVEASLDNGRLVLAAKDGRAIRIGAFSETAKFLGAGQNLSGASAASGQALATAGVIFLGQMTFVRQDARDIKVGLEGLSAISGFSGVGITMASIASVTYNQASVNLKYMNGGTIVSDMARAMGFFDGGASGAGKMFHASMFG